MPRNILTVVVLTLAAVTAAADLPKKALVPSFEVLEPLEGGKVVLQRIGPAKKGGPDRGRISILLRVSNPGPGEIEVDRIEILGHEVTTVSDDLTGKGVVAPGATWTFQNCRCEGSKPLIIDAPFPATGEIAVYLKGVANPLAQTVTLTPHVVQEAPLTFIGRGDDLQHNEAWSGSSNHLGGAQVFALDLGFRAWNGKDWSNLYPDANKYEKESFLAYGRPIYAMADGHVCSAVGDHSEPKLVGCGSAGTQSESDKQYYSGGNRIYVQTGDEISLYAHMQPHSIPPEYLVPGAQIKRGAYLGKIGFSGATSAPHVHVHVNQEPAGGAETPSQCGDGPFRPMTFAGVQSLTRAEAKDLAAKGTLSPDDWSDLSEHSFPHEASLLYPTEEDFLFCDDCTDAQKYIGVWRDGKEIDLRFKVSSFEVLEEKRSSLIADRFHLIEIDVVEENGRRYYLGVFRRGQRPQALWAMPWNAFKTKVAEMAGKGLRLIDVDSYLVDGRRFGIGAFLDGPADHALVDVVGWSAFVEARNEQRDDHGRALIDIETYTSGGQRRYVGVFQPVADSQNQRLFSLTGWKAFTAQAEKYVGYHVIDVESFPAGGDRQYVAALRPGSGTFSAPTEGYRTFVQLDERERNQGRRLIDVHVEE